MGLVICDMSISASPVVFPGPDGTRAKWVIRENRRAGTRAWQMHGSPRGIDGLASKAYAARGQSVTLHVSTTGPWFRAAAFRMGYYQGKGARLIWQSGQVRGRQPGHSRSASRQHSRRPPPP